MSRPTSLLAYFRSYSYHHILIACDGTETAELLSERSEISRFDHGRFQDRFKAQFVPETLGKYVVLINGMSDTQFTITSAKWASVLVPQNQAGGEQQFTTMAVDGELQIEEPKGVRFLNVLNESLKELGTDPNGVVFMLKTIFMGHRHDGRTEMITTIRPLLFFAYDVTALFEVTGAEYTFSFVGAVNGASKLPHVSSVSDGFQITVPKGGMTLGEFIEGSGDKSLPAKINAYYEREWNALKDQFDESNSPISFENEFHKVNYSFQLDEQYKGYQVGTNEIDRKLDTGDDDVIFTQQGSIMSVESILQDIMKSSKDVVLEGSGKSERPELKGKKFMFKITSTIDTGPDKFNVIYQIQRFEATTVKRSEFLSFEPDAGQGIEFDYIFTGQNVDVKSFDIKMQMGMAFFQTLASRNSVPTATDNQDHNAKVKSARGAGNKQGSGDQQNSSNGDTRRKPLFLGQTVRSSTNRNKRLPASTMGYNALLSRHAAFENIEARMVIHGNPQLLNESTFLPSSVAPDADPAPVIVTEQALDARNIIPLMHRVPGYIKVNVKMPGLDPQEGFEGDFAQNFWYTGWYFLYAINNVFSDGEFTQELEMFSLPVSDDDEEID